MSNVFYISDLHLGHKNILNFAGPFRGGTTVEEHDEWIIQQWNKVVSKRDTVYILGDVVWGSQDLPKLKRMRGSKIMVRGNHDKQNVRNYMPYFQDVQGMVYRKGNFILTHCPIHPDELRGRRNVHGHVHHNTITKFGCGDMPDPNYINVSVETCQGMPIEHSVLDKHRGLPVFVE